jgi:hypothetical protein
MTTAEEIIYTQRLPEIDTNAVASSAFTKSFSMNLWGMEIEPTYWQAITIVILIFLLIFTLARVRYLYVHWSLGKSSISMVFWGFLLALILEGFLLLSGKTMLAVVFGQNNAPKPISTALDVGRNQFIKVLGAEDDVIQKKEVAPNYQSVVKDYKLLDDSESAKAKVFICE